MNVDPDEVAQGRADNPIKTLDGLYLAVAVLEGQLTRGGAVDTNVWNPTVIKGASRTALSNLEEWMGLLQETVTTWWGEAVTVANWADDGTPAKARGWSRLRLGKKWTGAALAPRYVYGYVKKLSFPGVGAGMADTVGEMTVLPYRLEFHYADVDSLGP